MGIESLRSGSEGFRFLCNGRTCPGIIVMLAMYFIITPTVRMIVAIIFLAVLAFVTLLVYRAMR